MKVYQDLLCAYLDKTCYWATVTVGRKYSQLNISAVDCFSNARLVTSSPVELLKKYDFKSSSIKVYAVMTEE